MYWGSIYFPRNTGCSCYNNHDEMKIAASHALAKLAKEDVPDNVRKLMEKKRIEFGREYIIPKPFDPRVLFWGKQLQ